MSINTRLFPWERCTDWFVICIGIDDLVGVTVPSMVRSLLPETFAVEIGLRNAKESKSGDTERQLEHKKPNEEFGGAPMFGDSRKARQLPHLEQFRASPLALRASVLSLLVYLR